MSRAVYLPSLLAGLCPLPPAASVADDLSTIAECLGDHTLVPAVANAVWAAAANCAASRSSLRALITETEDVELHQRDAGKLVAALRGVRECLERTDTLLVDCIALVEAKRGHGPMAP